MNESTTMPSPDATATTFSLRRELDKLPAETQAVYEHRLRELDTVLRQISPYTLRDDSRLAYRYIEGRMPYWTPLDVAHESACTQHICDAVPYQAILQPFLRSLANRLKQETGADWKAVWAAVAELGPEIAKLHLMYQHGVMLPDFQPAAQ